MILLIEDNELIASNIKTYLELHDFRVEHMSDGLAGLESAQQKHYDCIILDVMLPGMDGFEILKNLRKNKGTPVIMTTAKGTLDDKSTGFDQGADDYLVKPFELKELLMRVQALIKRSQTQDLITFQDIQINMETNQIRKSGTEITLPLKERQILSLLIQANGHVVSRSEIVEEIRGGDSIRENDSKLDVYISNLRKKLHKSLIITMKGVGYRIRNS